MNKLLFRSCEAVDGRVFALLTDQPHVEEDFDAGYKVAYKDMADSGNSKLLAKWKTAYTVEGAEFTLLPDTGAIPPEIISAFTQLADTLLKGVDVLFCDYNLGVEGDLPMANEMMDKHTSTDFVLFSGEDLVGKDPKTQPYMVSYAQPRYEKGRQLAKQHRIYCKTDHFPFCQAFSSIVTQRKKDNLMGAPIRSDLTPYIDEPTIEAKAAKQALAHFGEILSRFSEKPDTQTRSLTDSDIPSTATTNTDHSDTEAKTV